MLCNFLQQVLRIFFKINPDRIALIQIFCKLFLLSQKIKEFPTFYYLPFAINSFYFLQ